MASQDKDSLIAEVTELREKLRPQLERDRATALSEGRGWSESAWLAGTPSLSKYPAGPCFLPRGPADGITLWTGFHNMNSGDWFNVALGSAALYAAGLGSGALGWLYSRSVGRTPLLWCPGLPLLPLCCPSPTIDFCSPHNLLP